MNGIWFLRWPLIIFLAGLAIRVAGVLFKIRHWPSSDQLIMVGSITMVVAIVFAIIKIAIMKKPGK